MAGASFMTLSAKLLLNVHDLNNEMTTGNVVDIRTMAFLDQDGKRVEVPAVSGRMVKHWHQEMLTSLAQQENLPLCEACRSGDPVRPGVRDAKSGQFRQLAKDEDDAVKDCVICDVHGYLIAQGAKGDLKGKSLRRNSRAMFSWVLPVLNSETVVKQVTHTRVSSAEKVSEESEQAGQALFYKSYASALVAFVSVLDLDRIGSVGATAVLDETDKRKRQAAAIEAYRPLLSGRFGAAMSHSIPHVDCREVVVAVGEKGPLPVPPSAIYDGYVDKLVGLLPSGATVFGYGVSHPIVKEVGSLVELFDKVLGLI